MTREEAIKVLENATIEPTWGGSFRATSEALDMAIEALQTDIVRCKDCKHRYTFATNETGTATHYYVCDFMDAQYEDEGYCSHGERSEE